MAISKRVSNTGQTAGHGMSKIEVQNELAKEERDLVKAHKGQLAGCGNGCSYTLNESEYDSEDAYILSKWLRAGNCPHCANPFAQEIFRLRNSLVEHCFVVDGFEFVCLRKPIGYRPRKIVKPEIAADSNESKVVS